MKKVVIITLGFLLIFSAIQAGNTPNKLSLFFSGGLTMPLNPESIRDSTSIGYNGNAHIGYQIAHNTDVILNFDYHILGSDKKNQEGGDWQAMMIGSGFKHKFRLPESNLYPFAGIGLGFAKVTKTERTFLTITTPSRSDTKFYYEIGGGITINRFFIQTKFIKILTEEGALTMVPLTVGVHF